MSTNSATLFEGPMDPTDFVDYAALFGLILADGETILPGFTVAPTTEAAALGFEVSSSPPPFLEVGDETVVFWCEVDSGDQANVAYDDDGVLSPVEVTITTSAGRTYQRTWLIPTRQL